MNKRALLGIVVSAFAMFCFAMSVGSIWFSLVTIYLAGIHSTYIYMADQYMRKENLEDVQETTWTQEKALSKLFLYAILWPKIWLSK